MKYRYPFTIIGISVAIIASMAIYGTVTNAEYNKFASATASILLILIQISIIWIGTITFWNICRKATNAFVKFLFELIDKIKE